MNSTIRLVSATSGAPSVSMIQETPTPATPTRITEPMRERVEMIAMVTRNMISRPGMSLIWSMPCSRGGSSPMNCRPPGPKKAAMVSTRIIAKIHSRCALGLRVLPSRLTRRPHRLARRSVNAINSLPVKGKSRWSSNQSAMG